MQTQNKAKKSLVVGGTTELSISRSPQSRSPTQKKTFLVDLQDKFDLKIPGQSIVQQQDIEDISTHSSYRFENSDGTALVESNSESRGGILPKQLSPTNATDSSTRLSEIKNITRLKKSPIRSNIEVTPVKDLRSFSSHKKGTRPRSVSKGLEFWKVRQEQESQHAQIRSKLENNAKKEELSYKNLELKYSKTLKQCKLLEHEVEELKSQNLRCNNASKRVYQSFVRMRDAHNVERAQILSYESDLAVKSELIKSLQRQLDLYEESSDGDESKRLSPVNMKKENELLHQEVKNLKKELKVTRYRYTVLSKKFKLLASDSTDVDASHQSDESAEAQQTQIFLKELTERALQDMNKLNISTEKSVETLKTALGDIPGYDIQLGVEVPKNWTVYLDKLDANTATELCRMMTHHDAIVLGVFQKLGIVEEKEEPLFCDEEPSRMDLKQNTNAPENHNAPAASCESTKHLSILSDRDRRLLKFALNIFLETKKYLIPRPREPTMRASGADVHLQCIKKQLK